MLLHGGMRSSCALIARIAISAGVACSNAQLPISEHATLAIGTAITLDTAGLLVRFDSSFAPLSVRARSGGFAVLDPKAHQLVLLDTSLSVVSRVGAEGSGPGELRGPVRLERWERGLAVGEGQNARISLFTSEGRFRGTVQRRYLGGPFAISERGVLMTPVQTPPHLVDVGSINAPFPRRTGSRPPAVNSLDERHTGRDLIVRRADGLALMIENRTGSVLQLRDDGTVTAELSFPPGIVGAWLDYRRRRVALFEERGGGRVFSAPLLKDVSVAGNHLLLTSSSEPYCVLLIDPELRTIRSVRSHVASVNEMLCRSESVALTDRFLVVAVDDSLLRFRSPLVSRN
jgi:hypothetical protein